MSDDHDFMLLRPIAESLVKKGEWSDKVLSLFSKQAEA